MSQINYSRFMGRLPYASELFGTYRPMIGWASKRKGDRIKAAASDSLGSIIADWSRAFDAGNTWVGPPQDRTLQRAEIGRAGTGFRLGSKSVNDGSFLVPALRRQLAEKLGPENQPQSADDWRDVVGADGVGAAYGQVDDGNDDDTGVVAEWRQWSRAYIAAGVATTAQRHGESAEDFKRRRDALTQRLWTSAHKVLDRESQLAAAITGLAEAGKVEALERIFYSTAPTSTDLQAQLDIVETRFVNPFLEFDPRDGLKGASVSPVGIVHLFRQYFFEFDTFLGPAVGHVWLTPGSVVELVESSTRKTTIEKATESIYETRTETETEDKRQEDISDSIKDDNKEDTKLGFSTTVNQSWPTGDMTATASINLDKTQQQAREHTQKRMREQSQRISTEIRSSYKTTFKTVTETTDVSSKRYVLENKSLTDVQNEMRRKMRQVGVQVQDVGSYLCWETFVDDPGSTLGLANLVHIAKPPDTTVPPNPTLIPTPDRKPNIPFTVKTAWGYPNIPQYDTTPQGCPLGRRRIAIDIPDGYTLEFNINDVIPLTCTAATGEGAEGFRQRQFLAVYLGNNEIDIGVVVGPGGLKWDEYVAFDLSGTVALVPTADRLAAITAQNDIITQNANDDAKAADHKASEAAFFAAAKERIEIAASVKPRLFEDLREEERTVVYRALIKDLMAGDGQTSHYDSATVEQRHIYATVINALFDIEKMLYFVAPEWWKARPIAHLRYGERPIEFGPVPADYDIVMPSDNVVTWSDKVDRDTNYYITDKSQPARLGSSLGWLLQLDGDDNRNRFLNAPWVRAVIPIRPGMEDAAVQWLQAAKVEGAYGLADDYAAAEGEAKEITKGLAAAKLPCSSPPTVADAISYLCVRIADKHRESSRESLFPDRDGINDKDKVWSTPIDKVYEHGFYPLERSFRADPVEPPSDSRSPNFQIMAQWTEILPTDQIVPVAVEYNPVTGRMVDKNE